MNLKSAAQTIRDTVSMDQVINLYGYKLKHEFMVCPFHGDTDASLRVYKGDRGWHCYGCGRGGSVIDFVMEHENCDFKTAVHAIDNALHLNLFSMNENPYEAEDNKNFQDFLDKFVSSIYRFCDVNEREICCKLESEMRKMKQIRDKPVQDRTADECTYLLNWDDECQYLEYKWETIRELQEEVAAWRRKARRLKI